MYISTCQNIYYNLALEDWLYKNGNFDNGELLLLWRNQPCIVIGRHQNVWAECHVLGALGRGVDIARRRSGGGTVYHDLGNLNCTFFTSRKNYNRKQNLEVVAQALHNRWRLNVRCSERDDLVLDDHFKISGTAAKLGRNTAYHHCTVLFDVCVDQLHTLLHSPMKGLESRATQSTRSVVKNLCEVDRTINYTSLVDSVMSEYLSHDHKHEVAYVNPAVEMQFPGIGKLHDELKTWDWTYARSPSFSLKHSASGPLGDSTVHLSMHMTIEKDNGLTVTVKKGVKTIYHSRDAVCLQICHAIPPVKDGRGHGADEE
ncbi:Lipoyltransferase 1, mitochondrial [Lamellibrachia satsuma]|nr:Lipoyltransferase 1, mitochondrial [Lamellibrachia satsuma]